MKKVIFILFIMTICVNAKVINGVAMSVNGLAITTAEIKAVQKQFSVDKSKAIDMLVMDRVQQSVLKNISVPDSEVNERISLIAQQNNISVDKMKKVLSSQGTKWHKYKERIRNMIKKDKFFRTKIAQQMTPPSESELKSYYAKNKKSLNMPMVINVIEYTSPSKDALDKFLKTKAKNGIKSIKKKLYTKNLEESMFSLLMRTQDGAYTRPMNAGDKYIMYKVLSKQGKATMPFELAKPILGRMYQRDQQQKLLKEYFEKEKLKAKIKKLR